MSTVTANRIQKLRQKLTEKDVDGMIISQPDNRYYLSGFDGSAGYLLITQRDMILATDFRYVEQVKMQAPDYRLFQITGNTPDWLLRLVADLDLSRLGFESAHVTLSWYTELSDFLKKTKARLKLVPLEGVVESLRAVKEPEEIEFIARAADISDKALEYITDKIHAGVTEKEIAWEIEKFMRENGSQSLPFEVIVASGPNAALPHAKPSTRQVNPGEPVVIDIGARYHGYGSDLTRTICIGEPDAAFKKVYDIVLGAQLAAIAIIKAGMNGAEADSLSRTVITEASYAENFGHGLGHGVGLSPHEQPRLGPNSTDTLNPGMVFTIEPGIYLPGWGGVRIEDTVVMENSTVRVLSRARK